MTSSDAEQAPHERVVGQQRLHRPGVDDAALVEHHGVAREALHDAEVLLDEDDRGDLRRVLERPATSVTRNGRDPSLVDQQDPVVVQQRAAIATICC